MAFHQCEQIGLLLDQTCPKWHKRIHNPHPQYRYDPEIQCETKFLVIILFFENSELKSYLLENFVEVFEDDSDIHVDDDEENDQNVDNEEENSQSLFATVTDIIFAIIGHGLWWIAVMLMKVLVILSVYLSIYRSYEQK